MQVLFKVKLNEKYFLRDPETSRIGRKIIFSSVELIEKLGIEAFTFKKLASEINTTEATIYRYFENKHNLLVYLTSWYWAMLEFQIDYSTANINDSNLKLKKVIDVLLNNINDNTTTENFNEELLRKIIISESSKSYLTKDVDKQNKEGFFFYYKSLCKKIASILLEINPNYNYPRALSISLIENAYNQLYFADHLPSLTDLNSEKKDLTIISGFLETMVIGSLRG
jgi:AcrR family transcriptional regulator